MRELVILSGKGGTGKTTIAAALASLASKESLLVLADADVDAGNLGLVLAPCLRQEHVFISGQVGIIDTEQCESCGTCQAICRFDAIEPPPETDPMGAYRIDPIACEGCAACRYACPMEAIRMEPQEAGLWHYSETDYGPLFHARLFAGGENSGKLVALIKQEARKAAMDLEKSILLVDGPPGIGCPVIAAISGADLALLVTEPTIAGVHDLERVLGVAEHFGVASAVVINKADLNLSQTDAIEHFCRVRGFPVVGRVPYDLAAIESMVQGVPVTEYAHSALVDPLNAMWSQIKDTLQAKGALHVTDVGREEIRHAWRETGQ